jgi:hypothetical protein
VGNARLQTVEWLQLGRGVGVIKSDPEVSASDRWFRFIHPVNPKYLAFVNHIRHPLTIDQGNPDGVSVNAYRTVW